MKKNSVWYIGRVALAALSFLFSVAAFSGVCVWSAGWMKSQFAPGTVRMAADFGIGAAAVVAGIVMLTVLFGRFYCSVICPFGILQDILIWFSRRKNVRVPNLPKLRYLIAGVVFGMLILGWSGGLLILDPYSVFGRLSAPLAAGGMVVLIVIAVLALWKKRIFCTALCPVGTLLGILSKKPLCQLSIDSGCVKCGKCVSICPADCIELSANRIDQERCLRCMACVSACPVSAINWHLSGKKQDGFDPSRRKFLINSGVLIAGLALGAVLAKAGAQKVIEFAKRFKFLPPGAGDAERFSRICTGCQLCRKNCPSQIIVADPVSGQVALDLEKGRCRFDCNRCSDVCPTGALQKLPLARKQKLKIAEAAFNPQKCRVFQEGEKCGLCAGVCPTGAVTLRKSGAPRFKSALCIGCGACAEVCPVRPEKAFSIKEIEKQTFLKG